MNVMNAQDKEGRASRPATRSAMSKYAKPGHKCAARALGYGLTLGDSSAWFKVSAIWQARLTPEETATVASVALQATDADLAQLVASHVLEGAGVPLPTFDDLMSDARFWADIATPDERAAYAVACFNRFTMQERDDFRAFIGGD
jgi:hypothetical protein